MASLLAIGTLGVAAFGEEAADTGALEAFDNYPRPKTVAEDDTFTVAYVHNSTSYENQMRCWRQAQIEAYNRGWEWIDIEATSEETARSAIINAINQEVDAIIVYSIDNFTAKQDLLIQAREAGIGVYTAECTACDGNIINCTIPAGEVAMNLMYKVGADLGWVGGLCITTCYTFNTVWERTIPVRAMIENGTIYPNYVFLDEQSVDFSASLNVKEQCFQFMQTWIQKYADEMNSVFVAADQDAVTVAEAALSSGRTVDDLKIFTIDGSQSGVAAMRKPENPIAYNYTQPLENYIHSMFELAYQIQVLGLNPGDEGCLISQPGVNWNFNGVILTKDNVPEEGASIHCLYDYYDADDAEGWWNWSCPDYEVSTFY